VRVAEHRFIRIRKRRLSRSADYRIERFRAQLAVVQ
jgi:hypothetical protein